MDLLVSIVAYVVISYYQKMLEEENVNTGYSKS
jgi:hypothetical protein